MNNLNCPIVPLILLALIFSTAVENRAQEYLYNSPSYKIREDSVIQGSYFAHVLSRDYLQTNYLQEYENESNWLFRFSFSINGDQQEFVGNKSHSLLISGSDSIFVTPLYEYENQHKSDRQRKFEKADELPSSENKILIKFRVDMRDVLDEFDDEGFYETATGTQISKSQFQGLYLNFYYLPPIWHSTQINEQKQMQMLDEDKDGRYEITVTFTKSFNRRYENGYLNWKLTEDITSYPQYVSPNIVADALYNMALEELGQSIRGDSTFMAGAKWTGVWTRDISYSILLSLAMIHPRIAKKSLMAKVHNGKIIQDTGTGGSWPVSTDRMIWAAAAWEIYMVTGDRDWLEQAYTVIKNSVQADLQSIFDPEYGLVLGESTFLDWREQSYPRWMDPKDIFSSFNLGTNAVHYQTYVVLTRMAEHNGGHSQQYKDIAQSLKEAINSHFWSSKRGYYGQYLYGRNYRSLSTNPDYLGESLCILFGIANTIQAKQIFKNIPVLTYGVPCFYPQFTETDAYHNNAIWPFVVAYWTWAAAQVNNIRAVEHGLASVYRAAALFLTNKENLVAQSGDCVGTVINSDRQLWSIAGNLALVYRVLFGMHFTDQGLIIKPFIPTTYSGKHQLHNFTYRNSRLTSVINGYGSAVDSVKIDGKAVKDPLVSAKLKGNHRIEIWLDRSVQINESKLAANRFAPAIPLVNRDDDQI